MPPYWDIERFSGAAADWDAYMEGLEPYLIANDSGEIKISDNAGAVQAREKKRRSILLSVIGADTYFLLRNLCPPTKPAEKSCNEIAEIMKKHFSPTPSETVQRFKFHTCKRKQNESVAVHLSELRELSEN